MKIIKYKFGTEETLNEVVINCPTQEIFDLNYPIAEKEAYEGEITVEGEFDDPITEPTQLDIIEAQVTYTALMTDTLLGG